MWRFWTRACFIAAVGAGISSSDTARATSVAISRMGEGVVCNGWAVDADIVATAAHCLLRPGHYSISTGEKVYHALRAWIHPEYSTENFYHLSLGKQELNPDLALLRIMQKDFAAGGEKIDQSSGRGLPPASTLYAVRPIVPDRTNSDRRNIEEKIEYNSVQYRDHGLLISNSGKPYPLCPGDFGTPLYAEVGNERTVVGVIVGNRTHKVPTETFCGSELHVITASVVMRFVDFIRRSYRENSRPWMPQ